MHICLGPKLIYTSCWKTTTVVVFSTTTATSHHYSYVRPVPSKSLWMKPYFLTLNRKNFGNTPIPVIVSRYSFVSLNFAEPWDIFSINVCSRTDIILKTEDSRRRLPPLSNTIELALHTSDGKSNPNICVSIFYLFLFCCFAVLLFACTLL